MTTVYTIGHSNRSIEDFVALLRENDVRLVADIRTVPKSRHNPHFGQDLLSGSLADAGIDYRHISALGGLRKPTADSVNGAWRNASFRGYADYMQTDAFASAMDELLTIAREQPTAIMCSEAVPWRCHRSLVGDALLVRDVDVVDIMGPRSTRPHTLTTFAQVDGTTITYPPEDDTAHANSS